MFWTNVNKIRDSCCMAFDKKNNDIETIILIRLENLFSSEIIVSAANKVRAIPLSF